MLHRERVAHILENRDNAKRRDNLNEKEQTKKIVACSLDFCEDEKQRKRRKMQGDELKKEVKIRKGGARGQRRKREILKWIR